MLKRLEIDNLALVEHLELEFDGGLTVLTGETGAGKSVVVTALALILGARADREYVRHGADKCCIEATFGIDRVSPDLLKQWDLDESCRELVIRRTISDQGQSTSSLNGCHLALSKLRSLAAYLGEILGQHAGQMLMNEANHLPYLDQCAGLQELAIGVSQLYQNWQEAVHRLTRLTVDCAQLKQQQELLQFQHTEISQANIVIGEEEELLTQRRVLDSARSLIDSARMIGELLDGEDNSALDLLRQVRGAIDSMAAVDAKLEDSAGELYDVQIRLEELRRSIESYGSSISDDPARLEQINIRLDEIYRLKRKYGGSEESILQALSVINSRLAENPDVDRQIELVQEQIETFRSEYSRVAIELSRRRVQAAAQIETQVVSQLAKLAIKGAQFQFTFGYEDDPGGVILDDRAVAAGEHGLETVFLSFSANPGEPLRPLVKTASGGEISRVLLALTAVQTGGKGKHQPMLILDEVDAGIGGDTANKVARKLRSMSHGTQILVVSHLHQIARLADHHLAVRKTVARDKRPVITVARLEGDEVTTELQRMIALPD
ncbi:MAG: DNA repair protein RecN [bacterium]